MLLTSTSDSDHIKYDVPSTHPEPVSCHKNRLLLGLTRTSTGCLLQDQQCKCAHNTCGATCDKCCPLYNQRPWSPGGGFPGVCEKCQCHGHAEECYFDDDVNREKKSVNMAGRYEGGGVCLDCQVSAECENELKVSQTHRFR